MVAAMEQEQAEEALKNVKKAPHHMGHSRNPSAASAISFCSVISEPISEVNEKEYGECVKTYFCNLKLGFSKCCLSQNVAKNMVFLGNLQYFTIFRGQRKLVSLQVVL